MKPNHANTYLTFRINSCERSAVYHFSQPLTTLRQEQNSCRFADDIFKSIFIYTKIVAFIQISLKFIAKGRMKNKLASV